MPQVLSINLPEGRKAKVDLSTFQAVRRACRVWACNHRVAAYAAAPHEGLTPEVVAAIRERMIRTGALTRLAYSRRGEGCGR